MEGYLLVPPERTAIIGRPGWKPRFVTFGPIQQRQATPPKPSVPRSTSASKLYTARQNLKSTSTFPSVDDLSVAGQEQQLWLSVYKQKGDSEPISQNAVLSIRSCEVQSIQFKKSEQTIATLVITFNVDAAATKSRKRRSSRAGMMQTPTSAYPNSLLFRSIEQDLFNIYDWQVTIQPRIAPNTPDFAEAITPDDVPSFSGFRNPFVCNKKTNRERPEISNPILARPELYQRYSRNTEYIARPTTSTIISPSPSLRSRRSDLSSQSSYLSRLQGTSHSNLPVQHQPELPSPCSTLGYEEQLISGWTNAQGRSSALSHHTRASMSISASEQSSKIDAPRETILDRAFMLKQIPGSERMGGVQEEQEEGLSSIARFEKLMNELDEKKKARLARPGTAPRPSKPRSKSAWDVDEGGESDIDPSLNKNAAIQQCMKAEKENICGSFYDHSATNSDDDLQHITAIPPPAQRALEYISGRTTPSIPSRPSSTRPSSRSISQANMHPRQPAPPMPTRRPTSFSVPHPGPPQRPTLEIPEPNQLSVRRPQNAAHRLSFTEFTKRLSSEASSLLLVQSNVSGNSGSARNSRCSAISSEGSVYEDQVEEVRKGLSASRLSMSGRPGMGARRCTVAGEPMAERERCVSGWRGSGLGFGGEGGFL